MHKIFKRNFTTKNAEYMIKKADQLKVKTITMGFPDIYGRFIGKKYDPDYYFDGVVKKGSNCCNYLLGCDMEFTPNPHTKLSSFDLGYGDYMMKPDFNSLREITYINGEKQLFLFSDIVEIEGDNVPVNYAPRTLLRNALKELEKEGISLKAECEINFTAYSDRYRPNMNKVRSLTPITEHNNLANVFYSQANEELLAELNNNFKISDIPVKSIYGDSGEGQFKICFDLTDPITFSDNICLTKLVSIFLIFRSPKKLLINMVLVSLIWLNSTKMLQEMLLILNSLLLILMEINYLMIN